MQQLLIRASIQRVPKRGQVHRAHALRVGVATLGALDRRERGAIVRRSGQCEEIVKSGPVRVVQVREIAKSDLDDSFAVMRGLVAMNELAAMRDEPRVALAVVQPKDQMVQEDRIAEALSGPIAMIAHSAVERGADRAPRNDLIRSDLAQSGVDRKGFDLASHGVRSREAQVDGRADRSLDRRDFVQNDLAAGSLGLSRLAQSGLDPSELDRAEPDQKVVNQSEVDQRDLDVEIFVDSAILIRTVTTSTARGHRISSIDLSLVSAQHEARGRIEAESHGALVVSSSVAGGIVNASLLSAR